jgi:putative SOS response-associated peptidase YedK
VSPYHDRMLAVLRNEEIEPYLTGMMRHFEPACETLTGRETANPRAGKKANKEKPRPEGPTQGELF